MTQLHYDLIRKCILNGMPAIAQELLTAFDDVVKVYNEKVEKETKEKEGK